MVNAVNLAAMQKNIYMLKVNFIKHRSIFLKLNREHVKQFLTIKNAIIIIETFLMNEDVILIIKTTCDKRFN